MAQIRRQEFVVTLDDIAAFPDKIPAENEFIYVRQSDGKLKLKCGDGITAISQLPYAIDIGAAEQAKIDAIAAKDDAETAREQASGFADNANTSAQNAASAAVTALNAKIANDLTSDLTGKVASAETVKTLDGKITNLATNAATATDGQILASNGDGTSEFITQNSDSIEEGVVNKYFNTNRTASELKIADTAGNFSAGNVEDALAETGELIQTLTEENEEWVIA